MPEKRHGVFAWLLAQGFAGDADKNLDNLLEPTELFGYLQEAMVQLKVSQTPELFLPDNRPPRLNEEARAAIRRLASRIRQNRVNLPEAESEYAIAVKAAGKEIEPKLLYGLLLMKNKQRDPARQQFDAIKRQHPDHLLPLQGIIWVWIEKRKYSSGMDALLELVSKVPRPKQPDTYSQPRQQIFYWAGQLREFIALVAKEGRRPSATALDEAVSRHNADARRLYEEGRTKSRAIHADFVRQIATAESAAAAMLKLNSRKVTRYVDFPYDQAVQIILGGLDQ